MTPQEKAIELVEQYMQHTVEWDNIKEIAFDSKFHAKKCALIAVDEAVEYEKRIIKEVQFLSDKAGHAFRCEGLYWEQVKHEIEKL